MAHAYDSKEGAAYLVDPLTGPEPSQETGPGSHFYPPGTKVPSSVATAKPASPTYSNSAASPVASNNPFRKGSGSSSNPYRKTSVSSFDSHNGKNGHSRVVSNDVTYHTGSHSSHGSASPGGSPKPFINYREAAFSDLNEGRPRSGSGGSIGSNGSAAPRGRYSDQPVGKSSHHRRTSSLTARYPGDESHKPLDIIRRDSKKANRSPHLNKRHLPGADTVDRLDTTGPTVPYHHGGPYDAAMLSRNLDLQHSPLAAVADSNREALKATPAENIRDALERHVPIDGTAVVPPGQPDRLGRVYNYEEGSDMMRDGDAPGGAYKQWAGVDYSRDDIKGKGEPAFSLDKALKTHAVHERDFDGHRGIELSDRPSKQAQSTQIDDGRYSDLLHDAEPEEHMSGSNSKHGNAQAHVSRSSSLRKAGEGLKKRLSIRQKYREIHDGAVPE